jgi:DNA-binding MarR family transcriptional regulator
MDFSTRAIERLRAMSDNYGSGVLEQMSRYSSGESFLLRRLASRDEVAHPSDLQGCMRTSAARVAAILGSLEKKGLVTREIDQNDRRRIIVSITEEGRARANAEMKEMDAAIAEILWELGEDDTNEFIRLLERILKEFVKPRAIFPSFLPEHAQHNEGKSRGETQ